MDPICAAYLVVATEEFGRQIPFAFLERVRDDFKRRYGGGKADTAIAHALDKDFGYNPDYCVSSSETCIETVVFHSLYSSLYSSCQCLQLEALSEAGFLHGAETHTNSGALPGKHWRGLDICQF